MESNNRSLRFRRFKIRGKRAAKRCPAGGIAVLAQMKFGDHEALRFPEGQRVRVIPPHREIKPLDPLRVEIAKQPAHDFRPISLTAFFGDYEEILDFGTFFLWIEREIGKSNAPTFDQRPTRLAILIRPD